MGICAEDVVAVIRGEVIMRTNRSEPRRPALQAVFRLAERVGSTARPGDAHYRTVPRTMRAAAAPSVRVMLTDVEAGGHIVVPSQPNVVRHPRALGLLA